MRREPRVRLGIVGAGQIASSYAQLLPGLPDVRAVAVTDTDAAAAQRMASGLGCAVSPGIEAMSERVDLDAVVVCTPPVTHAPIAQHFLRRGVPVLCEKPLAVDMASARQMVDVSVATSTLLAMATKFRYVDDILEARDMVASGALGEILQVENAFLADVDMSRRWNAQRATSGGGVLIDNGTHSVDIVRYFLGPVTEVLAVEGRRARGLPVEEEVRLFLRSDGGACAQVDLSWSAQSASDHYLVVRGTRGQVRVGWTGSWFETSGGRHQVRFGVGYRKLDAMGEQLRHFCRAVAGEEATLASISDVVTSVATIEAAYASLASEQWTTIGSPDAIDPEGVAAAAV